MAWLFFGMLSTNFSAYSVGNECHTSFIFRESCFKVKTRFPASFLFTILQTFSVGFALGDCGGQFKLVMPFSAFQAVQRRFRCLGSLSSCKIQSPVSTTNIFLADCRRPRFYILSIFCAFRFSVKSSKHPQPRSEKHPQTWTFTVCSTVR